jgi:predicted MFS family arabinose efflux permease
VRAVHRLLGDEIEHELWPVLATVVLGFTGVFSFVAFFAVWAVAELEAPRAEMGVAFAVAAGAGILGAFGGGRLSDGVGRRPVIVGAALAQTVCAALLLVPSLPRLGAYAVLVALSFCQPLRGATQRALIADLVAARRLESAFGVWRVAVNLGAGLGPLAGAALVVLGWAALHLGTTAFFALSLLAALRLPRLAPLEPERGGAGGFLLTALARDRAFVLVFAGAVLAWVAYQAFETLMPISLTREHGLAPSTWGLVFAVNPVLTVLLQLRVTRWAAPLPPATKLALALLMLGWPFLALAASAAIPVVVTIVLVVTFAEMLWAPAAETLVVEIAPPARRGAYIGAATAANWLGTAVGPAAGLAIAATFGDTPMWLFVAAAATLGAAIYVVAGRSGTAASARPGAATERSAGVSVPVAE